MPFRTIKPKALNKQAMLRELRSATFNASKEVQLNYQKTVASWTKKVPFTIELRETAKGFEFFVGTASALYHMIDETGAEPHPIVARNADALAIQSDFTPKTKVGVIGSQGGGKSGTLRYRVAVKHPGFEPRKFTQEIAKKLAIALPEALNKAMQRAVEVSGHKL